MKHISLHALSLAFVAALLLSCQPSTRARRLPASTDQSEVQTRTRGIAEESSQSSDDDLDDEASDKEETTDTSYGDALEQPAALTDRPEIILHRVGYTVSYNNKLRIPNWVAWHLTAAHTKGNAKRGGIQFHEDPDVPEPRVNTYDYVRSGYDRGHLCPAGDNKWSSEAMDQSFLLTNVCPQDHGLNRGDWNEMEMQCRTWARRYGDIYIVAGPILFRGKHKTIGDHKVTVPEAFFKVVLCMKGTPKAIGFIYRNTDGNRPKGDYVNSIDQVERITGIDFFPSLPDDIEQKVEKEQRLEDWE